MTADTTTVLCLATPAEHAAVARAVAWLSESLAHLDASVGRPRLHLIPRGDAPGEPERADILIESMLPELDRIDEPWSATEARLNQRFRSAGPKIASRRYLCTIFRHVGVGDPLETRARIRRLNLLALELSRQTGLLVIDLDRAFADLGARIYATDFRLSGPYAQEAAAREIARTVLATGLAAAFPRPVQQALEAALATWSPPQVPSDTLDDVSPLETLAFRYRAERVLSGRSKEERAARLLRQFVQRELPLAEFVKTIITALRTEGLRACLQVGWEGASRALGPVIPRGLRASASTSRRR